MKTPLFGVLVCCAVIAIGCMKAEPFIDVPPAPLPDSSKELSPESEIPLSPTERVPRIEIDDLLRKIDVNEDTLIIDNRKDVETAFSEGHIPGAVPVPLSDTVNTA